VELEHSFTVPAKIDDAWAVLLDIERIAPCMPGASLDSVEGDEFTGTVKVKLGPINLTYKGRACLLEKDDATHRAVIDARGKDSRGAGTASATVTATLTAQGDETVVRVETDLDITGKPAQFGRGVIVDVGNKLIGQFASSLADEIRIGDGSGEVATVEQPLAPASPTQPDPSPIGQGGNDGPPERMANTTGARPTRREAEPIDLLESAGLAVLKRAVPAVATLVAVLLLVARWRRGRR